MNYNTSNDNTTQTSHDTFIDSIDIIFDGYETYNEILKYVTDNNELYFYKNQIKNTNNLYKDIVKSLKTNTVLFSFQRISNNFHKESIHYTRIGFYGLKSYVTEVDIERKKYMFDLIYHLQIKGYEYRISGIDISLDLNTNHNKVFAIRTKSGGKKNKRSEVELEPINGRNESYYIEQGRSQTVSAILYNKSFKERNKDTSIIGDMTRFEIRLGRKVFSDNNSNNKKLEQEYKIQCTYKSNQNDINEWRLQEELTADTKDDRTLISEKIDYYEVYIFEIEEETTEAIKLYEQLGMKWNKRVQEKMIPLLEKATKVKIDITAYDEILEEIDSYKPQIEFAKQLRELRVKQKKLAEQENKKKTLYNTSNNITYKQDYNLDYELDKFIIELQIIEVDRLIDENKYYKNTG